MNQGVMKMTQKTRLTVTFDDDVFQGILALRARPEYARLSLTKIINILLAEVIAADNDYMVKEGNQ